MFRIITSLLFGEEDKPTEDMGSVEAEDEDWHVVSHQDAITGEHQEVVLLDNHPNSAVHDGPSISLQDADISLSFPEAQDQQNNADESVHGILFQPKGLAHAPVSACAQKEKAWAQKHNSSRNAIQRQNRIRQGIQQQAFHLHQPGHRNICH